MDKNNNDWERIIAEIASKAIEEDQEILGQILFTIAGVLKFGNIEDLETIWKDSFLTNITILTTTLN